MSAKSNKVKKDLNKLRKIIEKDILECNRLELCYLREKVNFQEGNEPEDSRDYLEHCKLQYAQMRSHIFGQLDICIRMFGKKAAGELFCEFLHACDEHGDVW